MNAWQVQRRNHPASRTAHRPERRALLTLLVGLALLVTLSLWALCLGRLTIPLSQVLAALTGAPSNAIGQVVLAWRLPRVVIALMCGASLALAGALFQSLLRNPLGSPDVIGFDTGAWSGVLIAIIVCHSTTAGVTVGALLGGGITTLAIMLLSWRRHCPLSPMVLITVGIGVRALLIALNSAMIMQASLDAALSAGLWGAGSLACLGWSMIVIPGSVMALATLMVCILSRRLRMLALGDDTARGLGVPVGATRLLLMIVGVALVAASTALVGPIAFVALVAPHMMRRLSPGPAWRLPLAALGGALLLLSADMAAQHLFLPYQLPVGALTASLGGLYLLVLLLREVRLS